MIVFLWVRGVARCRVLGRCALGRTPLPQGIVWGGVGGLVVNCIVDASIYNYVKLLRARVVGFEGFRC